MFNIEMKIKDLQIQSNKIKKSLFIFFLFLKSTFYIYSQDSISIQEFNSLNSNYKDFQIVENNIFAITEGDSLVIWNIKNNKFKIQNTNTKVLAKNSKNEIAVGLTNGEVRFLNEETLIDKKETNTEFYNILFDKNDTLVIITNKSIKYKNNNYIPDNKSKMYRKSGWTRPSDDLVKYDAYFLDSSNRIWFGYDAGEWGGDLCFFELSTKKFDCSKELFQLYFEKFGDWAENDSIELNAFPEKVKFTINDTLFKFPYNIYPSHVKGITEDSYGNFYISESLMHFRIDGTIIKIEKADDNDFYKGVSLQYLLNHQILTDTLYFPNPNEPSIFKQVEVQEYLGPITFNQFNKSVYYYTNEGFFKIESDKEPYFKTFLFNLPLYWKAGLEHSVGNQMAVLKFEFIDENRFIFLTNLDGIGYYNGNQVILYK